MRRMRKRKWRVKVRGKVNKDEVKGREGEGE